MGFGMIRCDIDGRDFRLNIWDRRFQTINVSTIHDHPWTLESLVMSGCVENVLYEDAGHAHDSDKKHYGVTIQPGPEANQIREPRKFKLDEIERTRFTRGQGYIQSGDIIHESLYVTGTVTLIRRTNRQTEGTTGDAAKVFWPASHGEKWVDARPQACTVEKVLDACSVALARWGEEEPH